jgi:ADP-ribosylglycohydrolase
LTQGNDTASFGATMGSILGAYFGPEGLDRRWLSRFSDDLWTGLAQVYERSPARMVQRMNELPESVAR